MLDSYDDLLFFWIDKDKVYAFMVKDGVLYLVERPMTKRMGFKQLFRMDRKKG